MADIIPDPNVDGDDYEPGQKYASYRPLLSAIRSARIPEEVKLRRINHLKAEVIPFWHRCSELRDRESEELMAVFLKYNGPDGIRKHYSQEYDEIKARIASSGDTCLFEDMGYRNSNPISRSGKRNFSYGRLGTISYNIEHDMENNSAESQSGPVSDGAPQHHNINPDDDLSHKAPLLEVLEYMIALAEPFTEPVDETVFQDYYITVNRPRDLTYIQHALRSAPSYGATAFFNDILLLFHNCRLYNGPNSKEAQSANHLESLMKRWIGEIILNGEQLLAQYDAIVKQGPEPWPDPERILSHPDYYGRKPDDSIETLRQEQFERGQERVRQLRSRLSRQAPRTGHGEAKPPIKGEAQLDGESRKRPRENGSDVAIDDGISRRSKRQRSLRSGSAGPSTSNTVLPEPAAAKCLRAPAEDDGANDDADTDGARGPRPAKRQRLTKAASSASVLGTSSGAAASGSYAVAPFRASRKRAREPADNDSDGEEEEVGDGCRPTAEKRRRLMQDTPPVILPIASPEAGPATPMKATPEPVMPGTGSSQSQVTSLAGQLTPQPVIFPSRYRVPSSKRLKFSRNTITMSKIAKMGKKRPWLFGYDTAEGYGIYAFVKCPGPNCKHHFSSHPLKEDRAHDHILGCNQQIRDDRDMVREYARQVIKEDGRISDLTVDWARKSNLHLLSSNLQDNHPDNFPLSLDDDDDDD